MAENSSREERCELLVRQLGFGLLPIPTINAIQELEREVFRPAAPVLRSMLKSSFSQYVEEAVVSALGVLGDESDAKVLVGLVESEFANVQGAAIQSLCRLRAFAYVLPLLSHSRETVRIDAIRKIGWAKCTEAAPVLLRMLKAESTLSVQAHLMYSLGEIGSGYSTADVLPYLQHARTRAAAVAAIGAIRDAHAAGLVMRAMQAAFEDANADYGEFGVIAETLIILDCDEAIGALAKCMESTPLDRNGYFSKRNAKCTISRYLSTLDAGRISAERLSRSTLKSLAGLSDWTARFELEDGPTSEVHFSFDNIRQKAEAEFRKSKRFWWPW